MPPRLLLCECGLCRTCRKREIARRYRARVSGRTLDEKQRVPYHGPVHIADMPVDWEWIEVETRPAGEWHEW